MPKIDENQAPWHIGELMTQLRGRCTVVEVRPRVRRNKQTEKDGVPQWTVSILFCADGRRPQLVDATMTAQEMPANLVGKSSENGIALGAMLWRMNGSEGWAYSLDEGWAGRLK